jgi:alpha-1,2-mannosyltransferase
MRDTLSDLPPRPLSWLLWLSAILSGMMLFVFDIRQLDGLRLSRSHLVVGRDFLNVWTGGQLALSNKLALLYDYEGYMAWQAARFGPLDPYNYSYPPHSLFLATPFATMPYAVALTAWTLLGAVFFLWAARPYMPASLPAILAILTPAAIVNIWVGHYGFFLGGLWLLFFRSIDRFPGRSGAIAGLLTLKPHLGLLIALTLLSRKMWRAILVAGVVTVALIGLSGAVFGYDLWPIWLFDTSALQTRIMTASGPKFYFLMMPSTYVALRDAPVAIALAAQAAAAAAALFLFWKARHAKARDLAFISASATAIIMPYIFNYDLTVASLGFAVLLYGQWSRLQSWERILLWCAFASPLLVMAYNIIAPLSLLAGLAIQVRHATGITLQAPRRAFPMFNKRRAIS